MFLPPPTGTIRSRGRGCLRQVATAEAAAVRSAPVAAWPQAESTGQGSRVQRPGIHVRDGRLLAAPPARHSSPSATRSAFADALKRSGLLTKRYGTAQSIPILETSCAPGH